MSAKSMVVPAIYFPAHGEVQDRLGKETVLLCLVQDNGVPEAGKRPVGKDPAVQDADRFHAARPKPRPLRHGGLVRGVISLQFPRHFLLLSLRSNASSMWHRRSPERNLRQTPPLNSSPLVGLSLISFIRS